MNHFRFGKAVAAFGRPILVAAPAQTRFDFSSMLIRKSSPTAKPLRRIPTPLPVPRTLAPIIVPRRVLPPIIVRPRLSSRVSPDDPRRVLPPVIVPTVPATPVATAPVAVEVRGRKNLLISRTPDRITNLLVDINRDAVPRVPLTRPTLENALDEEVPPGEPGGDPETDLLRVISQRGSGALGGDPSRTISSQLGQRQIEGRAGIVTNTICAGLSVVDRDHCLRSFRSEQRRVQAATVQRSAPDNFIGWTPAYGRRIASEIRRGRISCR